MLRAAVDRGLCNGPGRNRLLSGQDRHDRGRGGWPGGGLGHIRPPDLAPSGGPIFPESRMSSSPTCRAPAARSLRAISFPTRPRTAPSSRRFFPSVFIDPLLNTGPRPVDPSTFGYVGNAKIEASVCMIRKDAGIANLADLMSKTLTLGGTTGGSQVVDFPTVEKNLLGVKFNLIPGYKGTREVGAAHRAGRGSGRLRHRLVDHQGSISHDPHGRHLCDHAGAGRREGRSGTQRGRRTADVHIGEDRNRASGSQDPLFAK